MHSPARSFAALFAGLLLSAGAAEAAQPVISHFGVDSIVMGETASFQVQVADVDGDLDYVAFAVSGPGISGWLGIGNEDVSGASATATKTWKPASWGIYTVSATVYDLTGSAGLTRTFEVFSGRKVISNYTAGAGVNRIFQAYGEIQTQNSPSAVTVTAENNSNLILWAEGRVVLKPGFHAKPGSFFWAAVDRDMDSYSDMEELADTDGDGMFDAWEVDRGLNMLSAADAAADSDNDGASNLSEFLSGRNPNSNIDAPTLPAAFRLVLRTPTGSFQGLPTSGWQLSAAPNP
jgi:hypothetical protein